MRDEITGPMVPCNEYEGSSSEAEEDEDGDSANWRSGT